MKRKTELEKYREHKAERQGIFETLIGMGVTKEQLESASEKFNLLADGDADVMMGFWRDLATRMSN